MNAVYGFIKIHEKIVILENRVGGGGLDGG